MAIVNGYCTLADLKQWTGHDDSLDDSKLEDAVTAVSRWIDAHCLRHFWQATATARTFVACDLWLLDLGPFNDLVSVTTIKTDAGGDGTFETTWDSSDYQLLPHNPAAAPETKPFTQVRALGSRTWPVAYGRSNRPDRVEITGTWGWAAIPQAVEQACLILAAETVKLKDAPFGVAGFGQWGDIRVRDNPKALNLLARYRRFSVLVG